MNLDNYTANWNYPTHIRQGIGRIRELPGICQELGMQSPLLVTDPGLCQLPMVEDAVKRCNDTGLNCGLFFNITSNPCGENVADGVSAFKAGKYDGVIAFGGGSALDAGKAIALMVGQDKPLWDFEDSADNWRRVNVAGMAPVVAVPTTSGTGSEVGRASVITDTQHHVKRLIFHPNMLPAIVILDAELTVALPQHLTAATGMDALSHALEAYCSPYYHPMAEGIALEAMRLVKNHLPRACANGQDLEARAQMMVSSTMGATAFQRGLGAMHALAHPLGAIYNSHHGLLNAILMPYVLRANREVIDQRITRLAQYIGLTEPSFDSFLTWVVELRKTLEIPHSLNEIGIDLERAEEIGTMAYNDPAASGNPVAYSSAQYTKIFSAAVNGAL